MPLLPQEVNGGNHSSRSHPWDPCTQQSLSNCLSKGNKAGRIGDTAGQCLPTDLGIVARSPGGGEAQALHFRSSRHQCSCFCGQLIHLNPEHGNETCERALVSSSNLGGNAINEVVLELLQAGRPREEVTMEHLEPRLQAELVASTGNPLTPATQK